MAVKQEAEESPNALVSITINGQFESVDFITNLRISCE